MSMKEEAFELFNQGRKPDDYDVIALGIKKATRTKYYSSWKKSQEPAVEEASPTEATPTNEVSVGSLVVGQEFEYEGNLYRIRPNRSCAVLEWAPAANCHIEKHSRYLPHDTLVKAT